MGTFTVNNVDITAHCWNFKWIAKNIPRYRFPIYSDEIYFEKNCPLRWKMLIEIENASEVENSNEVEIRVGLVRLDSKNCTVNGTSIFNITNASGEFYLTKSIESSFSNIRRISKCDLITVRICRFTPKETFPKFDEGLIELRDSLIIKGKVIFEGCCSQAGRDSIPNTTLVGVSPSDDTKQLQLDFKNLWRNSEFVDVDVQVEKDVVRAHKFVLCARSPVFKKMFQNDMKEKACNSVTITDMGKSEVESFLTFLYTGVVEDRKFETVLALYSAADKYEVLTLQKTCREILVSLINKNTASVIMKLADTHNDDNLKNIALKYICDNFSEVASTSDWNKLLNSDPRLASFVLQQISLKAAKK